MIDRLDDEILLAQFRRWLVETRAEVASEDAAGIHEGADDAEGVGLLRLIEEFTALRHELKLQTRSVRGLQEQTDAMLDAMRLAIEQFRAVEPKETQAAFTAGKSLAEAIADLDAALDRGRIGIETLSRRLAQDPIDAIRVDLDRLYREKSWFRRRLLRNYQTQIVGVVDRRAKLGMELVDALLEGFGLIQNRLRRVLKSERIEPIECVGRPVDPERMTVVDVVDAPGMPSGHVLEEIRRGYTWQGRLLNFPEVRASRHSS